MYNKQILVYQCPKEGCRDLRREISFEKGKGFNNPHTHLLSCVAGGLEAKLKEMYNSTLEDKRRSEGLGNHFQPTVVVPVTEREKAIHGWLRLIILKNIPLCAVEDQEHRDFSKYNVALSAKTTTVGHRVVHTILVCMAVTIGRSPSRDSENS
jgi:hypothetical protein